jgi:hypothetical protein
MRKTLLLAAAIALAGGPALAQPAPDASPNPDMAKIPTAPHHTHHPHHRAAHTGEKPIDKGPNTPEANSAYQGGGVVLQGAPGAPAPKPQATPPGQTPANAVPP